MNSQHSLMLNVVFITLGGLFHLAEYLLPDRALSHKKEFAKDVTAFLLLSLCGVLVSTPLINYYRTLDLSFLSPFHELGSITKIILPP